MAIQCGALALSQPRWLSCLCLLIYANAKSKMGLSFFAALSSRSRRVITCVCGQRCCRDAGRRGQLCMRHARGGGALKKVSLRPSLPLRSPPLSVLPLPLSPSPSLPLPPPSMRPLPSHGYSLPTPVFVRVSIVPSLLSSVNTNMSEPKVSVLLFSYYTRSP
eukprot:scaffold25399_cov107-Isochrysis_galbana.AAC.1